METFTKKYFFPLNFSTEKQKLLIRKKKVFLRLLKSFFFRLMNENFCMCFCLFHTVPCWGFHNASVIHSFKHSHPFSYPFHLILIREGWLHFIVFIWILLASSCALSVYVIVYCNGNCVSGENLLVYSV